MSELIDVLIRVLAVIAALTGQDPDRKEILCLSEAIYFEARGEPVEGQIAVAEVVLNRVKDARYPSTICEVVFDPHQFEFTKKKREIRDLRAFQHSVGVAALAYLRKLPRQVSGANHFYNPSVVTPFWAKRLKTVKRIGSHIFLRG